jgi:hypothetical protein
MAMPGQSAARLPGSGTLVANSDVVSSEGAAESGSRVLAD